MEPFPANHRRIYFILFAVLFLILLPAVILYADGWRFKAGLGFVRTGGVYLEVPYADATITLNGTVVGHSGFLQRELYIGDLAPAAYAVQVEGEGRRSWNRILVVEPQLVTDARVVLLPEDVTLSRLITSGTATSTKVISVATYNEYLTEFATSSLASSTLPVDEENNVGLFIVAGDLFARWLGDNHPPSTFCGSPSLCESEMSIKRIGGNATDARFFGGGVVYHTEEGGIYFTEIDIRPTPVATQLYGAPEAEMRLIDDVLLIKSGNILYQVEGL